jgi:hypothetical protein
MMNQSGLNSTGARRKVNGRQSSHLVLERQQQDHDEERDRGETEDHRLVLDAVARLEPAPAREPADEEQRERADDGGNERRDVVGEGAHRGSGPSGSGVGWTADDAGIAGGCP